MLPRRLHSQMTVTLRNQRGQQFKGEFGDPNGFPRPRREVQNIPHRALTVNRNSLAKDGDVVTYQGVQFLLCGQHQLTHARIFLALEIQQTVRWTRLGADVDPLTGMAREDVEIVLNPTLPVILDPIRATEELNFQRPIYRLLSGENVQENDIINGMNVMMVSDLLGLRVAELV